MRADAVCGGVGRVITLTQEDRGSRSTQAAVFPSYPTWECMWELFEWDSVKVHYYGFRVSGCQQTEFLILLRIINLVTPRDLT